MKIGRLDISFDEALIEFGIGQHGIFLRRVQPVYELRLVFRKGLLQF